MPWARGVRRRLRSDHRPVPRHPRVVGDQERTSCGRDVLYTGGLDPPVVAIQRFERWSETVGPLRTNPNVVDA